MCSRGSCVGLPWPGGELWGPSCLWTQSGSSRAVAAFLVPRCFSVEWPEGAIKTNFNVRRSDGAMRTDFQWRLRARPCFRLPLVFLIHLPVPCVSTGSLSIALIPRIETHPSMRCTRDVERRMQYLQLHDWITLLRRRKWNWTHRVASSSNMEWTSAALRWDPTTIPHLRTQRRPGHPKTRWTDDFRAPSAEWCELAADEHKWTTLKTMFVF